MKTISILDDFSEFPALRHCDISDKSGEEFYHTILNREFKDVFQNQGNLTVNLDDTAGYASSFLDEAFGNLVYDFTLAEVEKRIIIISEQEPHWKDMILTQTFPQWETRRINGQKPVVTKIHEPWYRLVTNRLEQKVWEQPSADV